MSQYLSESVDQFDVLWLLNIVSTVELIAQKEVTYKETSKQHFLEMKKTLQISKFGGVDSCAHHTGNITCCSHHDLRRSYHLYVTSREVKLHFRFSRRTCSNDKKSCDENNNFNRPVGSKYVSWTIRRSLVGAKGLDGNLADIDHTMKFPSFQYCKLHFASEYNICGFTG